MKKTKLLINPIFEIIHTQEELELCLASLENFKKAILASSSKRQALGLFKQLPSKFVLPIQEIWQNYQTEHDNPDLSNFISELEKQLLNLNRIELCLAFNISQNKTEEICNWLRTKLADPQIVIQTQYDPAVVAGCILEYQGRRYDLSLSTEISNHVK